MTDEPDYGTDAFVAHRNLLYGAVGLRLFVGDELDAIATVRIDDGLVTGLYLVRNPQAGTRGRGGRAGPVGSQHKTGEHPRPRDTGAESAGKPQTLRTCSG